MELDNFVRAVMRRWYIPVLLVALAVFGVWTYHKYTDVTTATATVVVLTSTPAPGEFAPPQFGFDAIDESSQLAERVAARLNDGTTADQLTGKISVSLRVDPNQRSAAPVYTVSAKGVDGNRAIVIANLAAEEAKKLYGELNQFDGADVRAAFQNEMDRTQADVASARADLATFLSQNDAYALPARTAQQLTLVSQLELANVNGGAGQAPGSTNDQPSILEARTELNRLAGLEPEYNRLQFEVDLAQSAVSRLESTVADLQLSGSGSDLASAQTQLDSERAQLSSAQDALGKFETDNQATNLTAAVQSQLALVNQLVVTQAASKGNAAELQDALTSARAELDRLTSLDPEYQRLNQAVTDTENTEVSLQRQILSIVAGQALPAQAQVKIFHSAEIQSDLFFAVLTYALGVSLAVLLAISIIYLYAQFERLPPSIRELEQTFNLSVTTQVPHHSA